MKTQSLNLAGLELITKIAVFKIIPNSEIIHCHIISHDYKDVELVREFYHTLRAITNGQPSPIIITGLKLRHTNPIVRRMVKNHIIPLVSYTALVVPHGLSRLYSFMCKMIGGNAMIDHVFVHDFQEAIDVMTEAKKYLKHSA